MTGLSSCRAVAKESQNRYSKSAKDWGWREFLQLHSLFDQEAGFLVADSVVFAAEVLVLKEFSEARQVCTAQVQFGSFISCTVIALQLLSNIACSLHLPVAQGKACLQVAATCIPQVYVQVVYLVKCARNGKNGPNHPSHH